ncbi:MAG TPA: response regulator [Myxococcaceae bacterium]|nr:response regulator [Myxococcaceae bacterium]
MRHAHPITILMADDDEDDRDLTRDAMRKGQLPGELRCVEDGEELLEYLNHNGRYTRPESAPLPELILLDLNMPRLDGREALRSIKSNPGLRRIPVIVLSTSRREEDVVGSYDLGANCFITKPDTFEGLVEVVKVLDKHWLQTVKLPQPASP